MAGSLVAYAKWRDQIAGILDERFYPLHWLDERVRTGGIDLLHNDRAIIGIEVRTYPGGAKELHGLFAAGDLDAIKELIGMAVTLGREVGCDIAAIESRPAWARELKAMGFSVDRVRITKELHDGA